MKAYKAPKFGDVFVWEEDRCRSLPPRLDLANHSPTGFSWGYAGSGPAQLALAILADVYDDAKALRLYQRFKEMAISTIPQSGPFNMALSDVLKCVEAIEGEKIDVTENR